MDIYSILLIVLPYLIGSIPTAVWVSKGMFGSDIRTYGSGNAGSTNMFRVFGFKAGIFTQLVDISKGLLAAALPLILSKMGETPQLFAEFSLPLQSVICGLIAVFGHIFPVLAGFRGGKGINTLLGTMLMADWRAGLICLGVFVIVLLISRFVSLSSMIGTASFPVYLVVRGLINGQGPEILLVALACLMVAIVVWTHRTNIGRLMKGTESRVGFIDRLFSGKK